MSVEMTAKGLGRRRVTDPRRRQNRDLARQPIRHRSLPFANLEASRVRVGVASSALGHIAKAGAIGIDSSDDRTLTLAVFVVTPQ